MSRIINTKSHRRDRDLLMRSLAQVAREFHLLQGAGNIEAKDKAAYLVLCLARIDETVEKTVGPWEKRGYWRKADRFRIEWEWVPTLGRALGEGLDAEDWEGIAENVAELRRRLAEVKLPARGIPEAPYRGAWVQWRKEWARKTRGEGK